MNNKVYPENNIYALIDALIPIHNISMTDNNPFYVID
jgi:hypothetical protein